MSRLLLLPLLFFLGQLNAKSPVAHMNHPEPKPADSSPPAINCPASTTFTLAPGECDTLFNYTVVAYDDEPGFVLTQLGGLSNLVPFPIGQTVNSFLVTDAEGNSAACSFTVTVNNFPHLVDCWPAREVSLGSNCIAIPPATFFLENLQPGCPESYLLEVDKSLPLGNGPWLPGIFNITDKDKAYMFRVRNIHNTNMCTGSVTVRDVQGPNMLCEDIVIPCEIASAWPEYLYDSLGITTAFPQISDACGTLTDTSFLSTLDFVDVYDPLTQVLKFTRRVWTATDDSGNSSTCEQFIYQTKSNLEDVLFPADVTYACADSVAYAPAVAGQPYIVYADHIFPIDGCAIIFTHVDSIGATCGQSRQVFRNWYLLDTETSEEQSGIQLIDIQDTLPPDLACSAQLTVTVNATACRGTVSLPDAVISDGCSYIASVEARWMQGDTMRTKLGALTDFPGNDPAVLDTLGVLDDVTQFPVGTTQLTYIATDACGNTGSCQFEITVLDMTPPLAVCKNLIVVQLGPDGRALVPAGILDIGSTDNCLPVAFKAKLNKAGDCQAAPAFDDTMLLCCGDLEDTLTATLRVYDNAPPSGAVQDTFGIGHFAQCTTRVILRDTFPPLCDNLPDITVNCAEFDPTLAAYGNFPTSCVVDSSFIELDLSLFDTLCKTGQITRVFFIVNSIGQTSYCLQQITVEPAPQHYYVRFPDDLNMATCMASGDYGEPEIFQLPGGCEFIDVSFTDVVNTGIPNVCSEIERTWYVRNLCQFNSGIPLVTIPNPPFLTGPVVSAPGTTGEWAPTALFGNFWSPNTNGYQYKQTIRIIDNQPPVLENCLTNQLVVVDSSNNNTQLWNESYWEDPFNQTSNLCEAPVDLSITATDLCSGGALTFRYLLFLDLNGDEIQETVVSSDNLPGFNTVRYNNVNTPNNSGGTIRQFDERQVQASQKWGFALQVVQSTAQATAALRFNTLVAQNVYIVPQLPHGMHRIEWYITDECGNQTTCSSNFSIRDGKAPDIICPDETTIYFEENPGIATFQLADLLWSATDNCTPSNLLERGLRLSGVGTGFPAIAAQEIDFTCVADGNTDKVVEVWARDASGNARFCEVNVHVDSCDLEVPPQANHIVGMVTTEDGDGVKDVSILSYLVKGAGSLTLSDTTDLNGAYDIFVDPVSIGSAFTGGTAAVYPYKNTSPFNGVSTFDLLQISRHILGLDTLDSPYKIIAADANRSGLVTSFDVVELRKLILGIYDALPDNTTWRFVPATYVFPDPINPFEPVFPESDTSYYFLNGGLFDFIGLKVGDVNASVDPQNVDTDIPERRERVLPLQTRQRSVADGEEFTATFSTLQPSEGFQFTMQYQDMKLLEILPGKGMSSDQFAHFSEKNALTVSCENTKPSTFSLRFRAARAGELCDLLRLDSEITPAAAWLPGAEKQVIPADVALSFTDADGFALLQNQPNPFTDKTLIRFQLPRASEATLRVFDSNGKVVFTQSGFFTQGMHSVMIDLTAVQPGVLYYQLETAEQRAVQKMIRL